MAEAEQNRPLDQSGGGEQRASGRHHPGEAPMTRTDRRWDISTWRDWLILAIMCLLFIGYCLAMYLFEPGIR
jgi:hypothetical protein